MSLEKALSNLLSSSLFQKKKLSIIIGGQNNSLPLKIAKQKIIEDLNDDSLKYATFTLRTFCRPGTVMSAMHIGSTDLSDFDKQYNNIKNIVQPYLNAKGELSSDLDLSDEEKRNLNTALQNHEEIRSCFDDNFKRICSEACGLPDGFDQQEASNEITLLQSRFSGNEKIGYVFINSHRFRDTHTEVLIIEKNRIIKPVSWDTLRNDSRRTLIPQQFNQPFFHTDLTLFVDNSESKVTSIVICQPQADIHSCTVLGLVYLKKLLKNNAEALITRSLTLTLYSQDGIKNYFFFPPPDIIHYSQTSFYHQLLASILSEDDSFQLDSHCYVPNHGLFHSENKCYIPLSKMLENSLKIAEEKQDEQVIHENRSTLDKLKSFRDLWLTQYEIELEQITQKKADSPSGENTYLDERNRKYSNIAHSM